MTVRDVILTITLMLGAGLASQIVADYLRAPRMLVLLIAGALLGPSVSGAIDVPLDSMGPQLLLTIGVSFILFHGGLQLSTRVLGGVVVGLLMLVVPGVILTAGITGGFFSIGEAGGSGYLGAFLAGLIVGNMDRLGLAMHSHHERDLRVLIATVADVMVTFVFITLGANLPWGDIAHHIAPAMAVVATLIVVARPLTVVICLAVDRRGDWSKEEVIFLAWTRETGVLPAALAGIVVGLHVPDADLVVTVVALAIVVTLGVQTTTKHWLARRLRLLEAGVSAP